MKRRQLFRAQVVKSQSGSSARRFVSSGPVLPFNPASIPGCQLWLDAADTSSILVDSSSNVSLWIDKSNTGTTATPTRGATANPITYVTVDGYRAIYINNNGSAVYNASTYSQLTIQSNFQTTADYSIFAVVNLSNVVIAEYQTIYGNARGASGETRSPNFGAGMSLEFNADGTNRMISSSFIGSGRLQTALISSSSALTAYTNTSVYASATNAYTRPSTDVGALPMIGGAFGASSGGSDNRFATGYFHEILFYNSVLTPIQRQKVEGYLAHKWGLQTSLPANHPHKSAGPTYEEPVFVPTLISESQLWLDGADATSITGTTSVTQWRDKSGNSRHLGVGSGTTSYSSSAINLNSSYMYVNSPVNLINVTVFILSKSTGVTNQTILGAKPNTDYVYNSVDGFGFYKDPPTGRIRFYGQGNDSMQSIFFTDTSTYKLYSFQSTGTTVSGWLNGISQSGGTLTTTRTSTAQGFAIGAEWGGTSYVNIWVTASIYEILVYNTDLTQAQRKRVEGYLAQKWGLQSSLPANHPYKTTAPTGIPRYITIQSVSALFNNSSISVPANAAVTLGTNNHTIEFWAYQTSRGQYDCPFAYSANATSTNTYYMAIGGYLAVLISNPGGGWAVNMGATVTTLPALNAWHHYAIVRNGTTFTIYINGISRETATSSISIGAQVGSFMIGDVSTTTNTPLFGYITNFRLVNGTAVYTSNFTPPTSPLTAIPNTQLLLQGLVDRSPNAFTVTSTGSVTLSTSVSPFV
jgi:hypothetical protein